MARKSKLNTGVIGLGIIGSRIAASLRAAGFNVYVWNRTPKPAPNFLASPAGVAELCDTIQLVVADSLALFSTIEALGSVLGPKHTVICNATVGADATLEAARMVAVYGAKFLDAPFTGSKAAAEKGQLVYYIGGDDETFRRAEPVLKASSKAIVKIGGIGDAATVKIATNMLAAVSVQTLVEACAIVRKAGIDPAAMTKALEHHGVRSTLLDTKLPNILGRDYGPHFSVKHMFKDVQLAIQAANNCDIDIPATTATAGVLYTAINQGWADLDFSATAKFYEDPEKIPEPHSVAPIVEEAEPPAVEEAPVDEIKHTPAENKSDEKPPVEELPAAPLSEPPSGAPVEPPIPAASENGAPHVSPAVAGESSQPKPAGLEPESVAAVAQKTEKAPVSVMPGKTKSWFGLRRRS